MIQKEEHALDEGSGQREGALFRSTEVRLVGSVLFQRDRPQVIRSLRAGILSARSHEWERSVQLAAHDRAADPGSDPIHPAKLHPCQSLKAVGILDSDRRGGYQPPGSRDHIGKKGLATSCTSSPNLFLYRACHSAG